MMWISLAAGMTTVALLTAALIIGSERLNATLRGYRSNVDDKRLAQRMHDRLAARLKNYEPHRDHPVDGAGVPRGRL
jgi:hypothetical protein